MQLYFALNHAAYFRKTSVAAGIESGTSRSRSAPLDLPTGPIQDPRGSRGREEREEGEGREREGEGKLKKVLTKERPFFFGRTNVLNLASNF